MSTQNHNSQIGFAALSLNRDSGGRAQIFPDGVFRSQDGRPSGIDGWFVKDPASLLKKLAAKQNPFVIDYEHQTIN